MRTFETTLGCLRRMVCVLSHKQIPQEDLIARFVTLLILYTGILIRLLNRMTISNAAIQLTIPVYI